MPTVGATAGVGVATETWTRRQQAQPRQWWWYHRDGDWLLELHVVEDHRGLTEPAASPVVSATVHGYLADPDARSVLPGFELDGLDGHHHRWSRDAGAVYAAWVAAGRADAVVWAELAAVDPARPGGGDAPAGDAAVHPGGVFDAVEVGPV
jgi:hypothetical protein